MGSIPTTLRATSRNLGRLIKAPKASTGQPRTQQQLSRELADGGGSQSEAIPAVTATAAPQVAPVPGAGTAGLNHTTGASKFTNHTSNPPPTSAFPAPAQQNTTKMASDEDYAAFLEKANADPNEGYAKTQSAGKGSGTAHLRAVDEGEEVPAGLREAVQDQVYVSDADEPFEGVCLRMKDGDEELPDEETFAKLVNHPDPPNAGVEIMDVAHWDTRGQYKKLVHATREATRGSDVMVYRISKAGARVEYFLVGVVGGKLVGVKASAVES